MEAERVRIPPPPPKKGKTKSVPGEIELSDEGRLLTRYFREDGFVSDIIEVYNRWVSAHLPRQIETALFRLSDGSYAKFTRMVPGEPTLTTHVNNNGVVETRAVKLYPTVAIDRKMSYEAYIYVDLQLYDKKGKVLATRENTPLFPLPVMKGSAICNLAGLTDQERVEVGECTQDPQAYFIIKGTEWYVVNYEKLKTNKMILQPGKPGSSGKSGKAAKSAVLKVTSWTLNNGTSNVELTTDPKSNSGAIELGLNVFGLDNRIPVMSLFEYYEMEEFDSEDKIRDAVLMFVKPDRRSKVRLFLEPSFVEARKIPNILDRMIELRHITTRLSVAEKRKIIKDDLDQQFFPHMTNGADLNVHRKLLLLCCMIARYAEHMAGYRQVDDRDSWSNKQLESAGKALERLFTGLWAEYTSSIEDRLKHIDMKNKTAEQKINEIKTAMSAALGTSKIDKGFVSAFSSNVWVVKAKKTKMQSISEMLKKEGPLSVFSQVLKVTSSANRQGATTAARMMHQTQQGYIDIVETPEGSSCGLVKTKASTARITYQQEEQTVMRSLLEDYATALEKTTDASTVIFFNGKLLGFGNGVETYRFVKSLKRKFANKGLSVVFDEDDDLIDVRNDGARVVRPLLVMEEGEVVLARDKLWDLTFTELVEAGAVEYLDPAEQEYALVAQRLSDARTMLRDLEHRALRTMDRIDELDGMLEMIEGSEDSVPDPEAISKLIRLLPAKNGDIDVHEVGRLMAERARTENADEDEVEELVGEWLDQFEPGDTIHLSRLQPDLLVMYAMGVRGEWMREMQAIEEGILKTKRYTHCEIDPNALFGVGAGTIPLSNHNQAPRNTYACSMGKQALGAFHSNLAHRFDSTIKTLINPTRPLFETQMNAHIGVDRLMAGQQVIVAISTYGGYNQEDSIIINAASVMSNLFKFAVYHTLRAIEVKRDIVEEVVKPPLLPNEDPKKYRLLDENGIVRVGEKVKYGDVVIGRVRKNKAGEILEYANVAIGKGELGGKYKQVRRFYPGTNMAKRDLEDREDRVATVVAVLVTVNEIGNKVVKVKIREVREPIQGDKFASRHAQKGTAGIIMPEADMPFTSSGMRPDILFNPHGIPSRMTLGKIFEILASKVAALSGRKVNATSFNNFDVDRFKKELPKYGFRSDGKEMMYNGTTGLPMDSEVFVGSCYYQALRHNVYDKIQARARGQIAPVTRQPVHGRLKGGGLRLGEMERDALIAAGASETLQERYCYSSDYFSTSFCRQCGQRAITDLEQQKVRCIYCKKSCENQFGRVSGTWGGLALIPNIMMALGMKMTPKFNIVKKV